MISRSNGSFLAVSARVLTSVGSALLSEAEALREGIRLMQEGTRDHIVVETDAQELVSLWQNMSNHMSEVAGDSEICVETMLEGLTS